MALVKLSEWEETFDTAYAEFEASFPTMKSERYRSEDETIFDALASPEADFTADEEGKQIAECIRGVC